MIRYNSGGLSPERKKELDAFVESSLKSGCVESASGEDVDLSRVVSSPVGGNSADISGKKESIEDILAAVSQKEDVLTPYKRKRSNISANQSLGDKDKLNIMADYYVNPAKYVGLRFISGLSFGLGFFIAALLVIFLVSLIIFRDIGGMLILFRKIAQLLNAIA